MIKIILAFIEKSELTNTTFKGNNRMKFSTLTLCIFFCWCQVLTYAQVEEGQDAKIKAIAPSETSFEERLINLNESKKREATLSLKLVQLRIQITDLEPISDLSGVNNSDGLLTIKETESELTRQLDKQKKWTSLLERTLYYPEEERRQAFKIWREEQLQTRLILDAQALGSEEIQLEKKYAVFSEDLDLINFPPETNCEWKTTGNTVTQLLFSHTETELENYFPKRDFITGLGSCSSSPDGYKVFNLSLLVASPKADKIYGFIPAHEFIILSLLDEQKVSLRNRFKSKGDWDIKTQSYFYQCQFLIGPKEEKILKNVEVDKILIRWSKTSDEYEIFELDFFRNQLRCLENQ